MSISRKIKRDMAKKQMTEEGHRRINKSGAYDIYGTRISNGKIGKNAHYKKRMSSSDFAFDWKKACERRVESFKMKNRQKVRAK